MNYLESIFSNGGLLSQQLEGYKERKTQIQMASAISEAFNNNDNLVVEAPTGCGKSLGYLIPAIHYLKETNNTKPIVIATAKKVLQKQIIEKDLPFLKEVFHNYFQDLSYALIKGRNNYICNKKFNEVNDSKKYVKGNVTYEELNSFNELKSWYSNQIMHGIGDIDDITFDIGKSLLEEITVTDNECTGNNCPYNKECFANNIRREASKSHILIVNYHILILDLQIKMMIAQERSLNSIEGITGILPPYDILVMDEVHRLSEIIRDFSGFEISKFSLKGSIERLHKIIYNCQGYGFIVESELFANSDFLNRDNMMKKLKSRIEKYSAYMYKYMKSPDYDVILTYEDHDKFDRPNSLISIMYDAIDICDELTLRLQRYVSDNELEEGDDELVEIKDIIVSVGKIQNNFAEFRNNLTNVYDHIIDSPKWIDKNFSVSLAQIGEYEYAKMIIQPIYVNDHIENLIFNNMKSVIATSATLRTGYDFSFFKETTNFEGKELALKSEFDLQNQMQIIVDNKMPEPNSYWGPDKDKYMNVLNHNIKNIIDKQNGGTLILATNIKQSNEIKKFLEEESNHKIYSQYDHISLPKILNDFKQDRHSCLIGTNSLWEGIDIPGESLNSIVICKLPFKHIDDPISKSLEMRGRSAFFEYSLPNAVISFVQGAGRLIRNENDSGIIYIADPRVINKNYGRNFLSFFNENNVRLIQL